jgi:tetratricopeptide (TPR) repeat protein
MMELKLGQWAKAEKSLADAGTQFEAILRQNPDALRYRLELGRTRIALGDLHRDSRKFPEALRSWIAGRDELLSLTKEVSEKHALAAEAASLLESLGNYLADFIPSEADPALAAARNTPFPMGSYILLRHGLNCLMAGDDEGYRRTCERILDGSPNRQDERDPGWYAADAAVLCAADPKARIEPSRYLALAERGKANASPGNQQYRNAFLSLSYYRAGKLDHALDRLDYCDRIATFGVEGKDEDTVLARAVRALVLHRLGRGDEAKQALRQALRWHPVLESRVLFRPVGPWALGDGRVLDRVVVDLVRLVLREACAEITGSVFRLDQWNALRRAWGEANFGRNDRARAAVDQAGPIAPNDADLLAARGFVLAQVGDTARAKADCDAALGIASDNLLGRYARGRLALAEGRPAAAEDLVRVLAQLPDVRTPEADRFVIDGLLASSDAVFARAVELRPKDPQLWVARGRYLAWHERWHDAAEAYARGVEPQTLYYDWIEYGCALLLAGDLDGYRRLCGQLAARMKAPEGQRGVFQDGGVAYVAVHLAALHPGSGIDPKVMSDWARIAGGQAPGSGYYQAAGMALERGGESERAAAFFRRSLELSPLGLGHDLNWYGLAIAASRLGQTEEARHWLDLAEASLDAQLRLAREQQTLPPSTYLFLLLEARVRSREARALLAPKPAG